MRLTARVARADHSNVCKFIAQLTPESLDMKPVDIIKILCQEFDVAFNEKYIGEFFYGQFTDVSTNLEDFIDDMLLEHDDGKDNNLYAQLKGKDGVKKWGFLKKLYYMKGRGLLGYHEGGLTGIDGFYPVLRLFWKMRCAQGHVERRTKHALVKSRISGVFHTDEHCPTGILKLLV